MPTLPLWAPILLAPFIGSFLGVLIRRLPQGRPVLWARSACETCHAVLGWRDLVPLLSHLAARGRCRHCGALVSTFHPAVELAALLIAALAVGVAATPAEAWAGSILGWVLLALAWIDAEAWLLPDALTLPLIVAGLAMTWWLDPASLADHAAASIFAYVALALVGLAYRLLRRREGMGLGDAKLLAGTGAWLGVAALPWVLVAAALLGLASAIPRLVGRRGQAGALAVPFGPPLAIATWAFWLLLR